ncbi:MAG: LysR family transcriptional regulator [Oligoflexales bacterium]
MELRHLRYFTVVAETKSFTKAANLLHVAQPAISKQIMDLEEELGFPLFNRSTKDVALTEAGAFFLGKIQVLQRDLQKSIQEAQYVSQNVVNTCYIGFLSTPSSFFLPKLVETYHEKYPENRLRLREGNPIDHLRWLLADEIDIAISRSIPDQQKFESLLIYEEPIILAISPKLEPSSLKSEASLPKDAILISKEAAPGLHAITLNYIKNTGIKVANLVEVADVQSALMMVEADLGIAFLPSCVANIGRFSSNFVHFDSNAPRIELFALWKKDREAHTSQFVDILRNNLTKIRTHLESVITNIS